MCETTLTVNFTKKQREFNIIVFIITVKTTSTTSLYGTIKNCSDNGNMPLLTKIIHHDNTS